MKNKRYLTLLFLPFLIISCNEKKLESYYIDSIYKLGNKVEYFELKDSAISYSSLNEWQDYKEFNNKSIKDTNLLIKDLMESATFYEIPPHDGYNRDWLGFIDGNNYLKIDFEDFLINSDYFDDSYFFGVYSFIDGTYYSSSYAVFKDGNLYNRLANFYNDALNNTIGNKYQLWGLDDPFSKF